MGPGSALALLAGSGRRGWDAIQISNSHFSSSPGLTGRSSIPETPIVEPRSRGVLDHPHQSAIAHKAGDDSEGAAIDSAFPNMTPHSRGTVCPRFDRTFAPLQRRGSRECRVRAAPAVSCASLCEECAHEHTGSAEAIRHSLRDGFTAYAVLSPATNSYCHRRWRIELTSPPLNLTPATGARTTRFCRTLIASFVLRVIVRSRPSRPA